MLSMRRAAEGAAAVAARLLRHLPAPAAQPAGAIDGSVTDGIRFSTLGYQARPCNAVSKRMANTMPRAHSLMRFLAVAFALAAALAVGLAPRAALAEGNEYRVSSESEWDDAVEAIGALPAGSEATVTLTGDVSLTAGYYNGSRTAAHLGVEGRHVTYRSEQGAAEVDPPYIIGSSGVSMLFADGDITLENVWLNRWQHSGRGQGTISSFYACGHTVEFAESFQSPIAKLYGGSQDSVTGDPHLIIRGDIEKPNSSGSASETEIYGGGHYASASRKGRVTGNVTIDLYGGSRLAWVYGGGYNAEVDGSVTVNLLSDLENGKNSGHIVGGGYASNKGPSNGKGSGTVTGDVTVNLTSGLFNGLTGGGSNGDSSTDEGDIESGCYAAVGGSVNVNFGYEGAEGDVVRMSTSNNLYCGSMYSLVVGDINVHVMDGADLSRDLDGEDGIISLYGMGMNDSVGGSVNIALDGGRIDRVLAMCGINYNRAFDMTVGDPRGYQEEYLYTADAINVTMNDGEVGSLAWFPTKYNASGTDHESRFNVYGNVIMTVNGGTITRAYVSAPSEWREGDDEWGALDSGWMTYSYVGGNVGVELRVNGGTFAGVPSVYGAQTNRVYAHQRVVFGNTEPVELYQLNKVDEIVVNNTAPARIRYYETSGGTEYPALKTCGIISLQGGTLALAGENTLTGGQKNGVTKDLPSLSVAAGSTLAMPVASDENGTGHGVLNMAGAADLAGADGGWLKTVQADRRTFSSGSYYEIASDTEASPKEGEVYVRSMDTNETAKPESDAELLDLDSAPGVAAGLYVEYTQRDEALTAGSTRYSHAWRIAQGEVPEVEEYHVLYEFVCGTRGASLPDAVTDLLPTDGNTYAMGDTVTAIQPTQTSVPGPKDDSEGSPMGVWTFVGYDADSKVVSDETLEEGFGSDTSLYIKFKGTWRWAEGAFTVSYSWGEQPFGEDVLYDADGSVVTPVLPEATGGHHCDDVVAVDTEYTSSTVYYTHDQAGNVNGSYTFSGWSAEDVGISEDGTFTMPAADVELEGTWTRNEMGQDQLTYDKNADAATGATGPTVGYEGGTVKVAGNGFTRLGYEFAGWNTQRDGKGIDYAPDADYILTGGEDVLYAQWERVATPLAPKAVSLVAYEGGEGSTANPDDALPEPVWRFEAEGWTLYVNGVKQDQGAAAFQWGYFAAGSETEQTFAAKKGVYKLRAWPLEGDPEVVAQGSDGKWYILDLDGDTTVVDEADNAVTVSVRDVVNGEEAEALSTEVLKPVVDGGGHAAVTRAACAEGGAHAHVAVGTGFEKNGIDGLPVADPSKVSLLYDDLIPNVLGGADRMGALDEKARAEVGGEFASGDYGKDFKYLDLVDKSDGNLWVATADGSDTTVFIPYSGDMTADKTISVVRFTGLTRDYTVGGSDGDVDAAVSASSATELDVTKSDGGITFTIPSGQFGPIELMWTGDSGAEGPDIPNPPVIDPDEPGDPDTPDTPDTPDEPDTPDTPDTPEPDQPDVPDTPEPGEPGTTGTPSEPAKPADPGATIPRTGDPLAAVAALVALAGAGAIGAGAALRRRR